MCRLTLHMKVTKQKSNQEGHIMVCGCFSLSVQYFKRCVLATPACMPKMAIGTSTYSAFLILPLEFHHHVKT